MEEMKLRHHYTSRLLNCMSQEIKKRGVSVYGAFYKCAEEGVVEMFVSLAKTNPHLVLYYNDIGRNVFMASIEHRQPQIYCLLHGVSTKHVTIASLDCGLNTMLHMAGLLAPPNQLNKIPGAALQMQSELQWFKEIESITLPKHLHSKNKDELTPRELFTKEHKELMSNGEKWMKDTASSCSLVGSLIATIMFAVAFTVPGGNDQNTASVLMFLGMLTSRYAEEDFLKSLPTKLVIGLLTLFISIATMTIAFCAALLIMLSDATLFEEETWSGVGVVVRDDKGLFIEGFARVFNEASNSALAEAMRVREALSWLKKRRWQQVFVETDCLTVVQALRSHVKMISLFGMVVYDYIKFCSSQLFHCYVHSNQQAGKFFVTLVYGFNDEQRRGELWADLEKLAKGIDEAWIMMGEFNEILNANERIGKKAQCTHSQRFRDCVEHCEVRGSKMFRIVTKLRRLKHVLKKINKEGFSEIHKADLFANAELTVAQENLSKDPLNMELMEAEQEACRKYNEVHKAYSLFLSQKAKVTRAAYGDDNSAIFHASLKLRRIHKKIFSIEDEHGLWCDTPEGVQDAFLSYYERLLGTNMQDTKRVFQSMIDLGPNVNDHHRRIILAEYSE
uniref:Uncharacterized protein n=1 Tax=Cannabis sativa TaxID=3483 RepID=A0A803PTW6_CANSA